MNKRYLAVLIFILVVFFSGIEGKQKMDANIGLTKIIVPFKQVIFSLFALPDEHSFGMIAGRNDDESTVRIVQIRDGRFHELEIPRSAFEPASQKGEKAKDSPLLFLLGNRIITLLDIHEKKEVKNYWGVGNVLVNTYSKLKMVDFEKQRVLTLFEPYYDTTFKQVLNLSYVLTIENLKDSTRVKQISIASLSEEYKTATMADLPSRPDLFFGTTFTIYRESSSYDWLCVDNNLDPIEHPLRTILNDNKALFYSETFLLLDMAICEQSKFAALIFRKDQKTRILLIAWDRKQPLIPVPIEFTPPVTPDFTNFSLSPSGIWLYFEGKSGVHESYCGSYLVYLNPTLPTVAFHPIKIDLAESPQRLTWMTSPEGLIVYGEKAFHYWDLSKFEAGKVKK